jgi:hypothetical protein
MALGDGFVFLEELLGGLGESAKVFSVLRRPARDLPRSSRYQSSAICLAWERLSSLVVRRFPPARAALRVMGLIGKLCS